MKKSIFTTNVRRLPIADLKTDLYQREEKPKLIRKVSKETDVEAVGLPIVSYRDGVFWIVDGQNRIRGLKMAGHEYIECDVRYGLTYEREAEIYRKVNFNTAPQNARDRLNAMVAAGDVASRRFVEVVNQEGFTLCLRSYKDKGSNLIRINAVSTLAEAYRHLGRRWFSMMLRRIKHTWRDNKEAISSAMIRAMAIFEAEFGDETPLNEFVKKLRGSSPRQIINDGEYYKVASSTPVSTANVIRKIYNKKRRKNLLPDSLQIV